MVALVKVLVGGILAFVGAIELRRCGAYAAEIASMQGGQKMDALRVLGIPVQAYLVLPRVLAGDLGARLPLDEVLVDRSNTAQRRVLIVVTALDLWPYGHSVMGATWAIVDNATPRCVAFGGGTFDSPRMGNINQSGDAGLVDVISQTVGKRADAIALNVRQSVERSALRAD